jgi:superfamily I DNA/RNA helicase
VKNIILGPPGTGKTTMLLKLMETELEDVDSNRIAFVSFTRKGVYEARERAMDQFRLIPRDLPFFRTLHSVAFRSTSHRRDIMRKANYRELGYLLGMNFTGSTFSEDGIPNNEDRMLFLIGYARNVCRPLKEVWQRYGTDYIDWYVLKNIADTLDLYKRKRHLNDFTDLIEGYIERDKPLPVKVAIIDEAQDLSALQWKMIEVAFRDAERIYIAGDDDQAIYKWSGADVKTFLSLDGEFTRLKQSFRLPRKIYDLSQSVAGRIKNRYKKEFLPREKEGEVVFHNTIDSLDVTGEDWLLLARNRYLLKHYERILRYQGIPYIHKDKPSVDPNHVELIRIWEARRKEEFLSQESLQKIQDIQESPRIGWYDAFRFIPQEIRDYYSVIPDLSIPPTIQLNTIHGVKGGEADNVALMMDMSNKTYMSYLSNPDDELRVLYVGLTRAKETLHIIYPQTIRGYSF